MPSFQIKLVEFKKSDTSLGNSPTIPYVDLNEIINNKKCKHEKDTHYNYNYSNNNYDS